MAINFLNNPLIIFLESNLVNLLLISLFLVRVPSFRIPFIPLPIYSHYIFRLLNLVVIAGLLIKSLREKNRARINSLLILSCLYFLFQSLSVIGAVNNRVFVINFEKLFSSFLFLFAAYPLFSDRREGIIERTVGIIVYTTMINVTLQLLMIFVPAQFVSFFEKIIHPGTIDILKTNLNRGRVYFEFYDEVSIPILFYLSVSKKKWRLPKYITTLTLLAVIFVSFFSNVRTRFLVSVFALASSIFIFARSVSKNLLKISLITSMIVLIVFAGYQLVNSSFGFSVIDRFLLQDKAEDSDTIKFRLDMIGYAVDMGNSHPLFGVGLGNFYEYLPTKIRNESFLQEISTSALLYPHNIFAQAYAESGIFGLISLVALTGYFLLDDIRRFTRRKDLEKALTVSFWSLFIFALLNPPTPLTFFANFFILRMMII